MFARIIALFSVCTALCLPLAAQTPPSGYVRFTGSRVVDAAGSPATGQLCAQVTSSGTVGSDTQSYSLQPGGGGATTKKPVCTNVVNGGFSMFLPDTAVSHPQNACIAISVVDSISGDNLLDAGYGCLQPTSTAGSNWCSQSGGSTVCNFDQFIPSVPTGDVIYVGPTGPQGPPGCLIGSTCTDVTIAHGTPSAFSTPWGFSPSWNIGGFPIGTYQNNTTTPMQSQGHFHTTYNFTSDITPDYPGAPGASIPAVYSEVSTSGGSNIQPHAFSGYAVNGGSQDAVGISGRAVKLAGATSTTSGQAYAAGVWGSAYQNSTTPGGVMGTECHIYQQAGGTVASDQLGTGAWSVCMHMFSSSTGSKATAGLAIDTDNQGFWNGIILDRSTWNRGHFSGSFGDPGTVGINGGSWNAGGFPETGIKMGNAVQHIWCNYGACDITAANGDLAVHGGNVANPTTGAGLTLFAASSQRAFVDFYNGSHLGGNIFFDPGTNTFNIQAQAIDTHINPNGGSVYMGAIGAAFHMDAGAATIDTLSGSGNGYACLTSTGKLYRSATACN